MGSRALLGGSIFVSLERELVMVVFLNTMGFLFPVSPTHKLLNGSI